MDARSNNIKKNESLTNSTQKEIEEAVERQYQQDKYVLQPSFFSYLFSCFGKPKYPEDESDLSRHERMKPYQK